MNYSLQNVATIADCDALLSLATKERADLAFKQLSDERITSRFSETAVKLASDMQGLMVEISATQTIISVLPEGPSKQDAVDKLVRLEYRRFLLEQRIQSYGITALLEKEMDLARVIREIEEVDAFALAVAARKTELS
ncbi:hypothetical protein [Flavobacterium sp.]|uniref:hypothetical protein n=1 Tax=Flavobacterium sp. TaxID=239 RepID=UPI0012073CD2|nr:hypothetical protein [Flavobacterium sp.]RZJ71728.1 MAG: hypothetical protein EOO49_08675 [Flavobacterium sp.]